MWLEKPLAENLAVLAKKLNMKPSKALSEAIFDWLKKEEKHLRRPDPAVAVKRRTRIQVVGI